MLRKVSATYVAKFTFPTQVKINWQNEYFGQKDDKVIQRPDVINKSKRGKLENRIENMGHDHLVVKYFHKSSLQNRKKTETKIIFIVQNRVAIILF